MDMKNNLKTWIIGGLITAAAFGGVYGVQAAGNAAALGEAPAHNKSMMQNGMHSQEMQKQCEEMMKNMNMQQDVKK